MKIAVLGGGRVGSLIARDLDKQYDVTLFDYSAQRLTELAAKHHLKTQQANLAQKQTLTAAIAGFDLIVGALPGPMGFKSLRTIIDAGKNVVDISFFAEDAFELDKLAKEKGVTAIYDAGIAPGMSNLAMGYHNEHMKINNFECYVGGLPKVREWPYEYKAVFSPIDVIEEYIRPARFVRDGKEVVREALSDLVLHHYEKVGSVESWNSDGLRSLIKTMPNVPNMIEKTLRFPGTVEYLKVLRETGFFSYNPVEINGQMVRPIDMTAKLLFPKWQLKPGEADVTIMEIKIEGEQQGQPKNIQYMLFDEYDPETDAISMARTTGYTCAAVTNLVAKGMFTPKGICPPEFVGAVDGNFDFVLNYLKNRNVIFEVTETTN